MVADFPIQQERAFAGTGMEIEMAFVYARMQSSTCYRCLHGRRFRVGSRGVSACIRPKYPRGRDSSRIADSRQVFGGASSRGIKLLGPVGLSMANPCYCIWLYSDRQILMRLAGNGTSAQMSRLPRH